MPTQEEIVENNTTPLKPLSENEYFNLRLACTTCSLDQFSPDQRERFITGLGKCTSLESIQIWSDIQLLTPEQKQKFIATVARSAGLKNFTLGIGGLTPAELRGIGDAVADKPVTGLILISNDNLDAFAADQFDAYLYLLSNFLQVECLSLGTGDASRVKRVIGVLMELPVLQKILVNPAVLSKLPPNTVEVLRGRNKALWFQAGQNPQGAHLPPGPIASIVNGVAVIQTEMQQRPSSLRFNRA